MEIGQIILVVIVLILFVYFIIWLFTSSTQLTKMSDAKVTQTIVAKTLKSNNNTSNYTYSMWLYVNDWNYRFGTEKVILARGDFTQKPSPAVILAGLENNLHIKVNCYGDTGGSQIHTCTLQNVPLQKWVNIIISLYGRTLDVYLDGKLVRTCVLPGVVKVNADADILVTPQGGFDGWTTNFRYWPTATNPQEAYNIYKDGLGGSILGSVLNKFRIQVSFLKDNKEQGSFQI
jgi:hypothetical protein